VYSGAAFPVVGVAVMLAQQYNMVVLVFSGQVVVTEGVPVMELHWLALVWVVQPYVVKLAVLATVLVK